MLRYKEYTMDKNIEGSESGFYTEDEKKRLEERAREHTITSGFHQLIEWQSVEEWAKESGHTRQAGRITALKLPPHLFDRTRPMKVIKGTPWPSNKKGGKGWPKGKKRGEKVTTQATDVTNSDAS